MVLLFFLQKISNMFWGLFFSFSFQVGNLGLLFMLLFFIYAALGVELFGKLGQSPARKKQNKDTHTHCSTHFARKGFWIQASLLQSRFVANFPPFFVSSLPVLTKERSHLHDPIYLHYCFFNGLTLSNSFCLSLCGKSVRKKKKRTSGKMKWKTTFW